MSALPQDYAAPGSDELLARRAARGDDDAFAELYRRYSGRLAAFGGRIVGDRTAGEDVAQTSLLKAYQAIRQGRGPTAVRPWLYRIDQNVAYESLRRRREIVGVEIEEGHEDQHEARLDRETLLEAVRVLPQRQRDVYLLRELNGLAVSEIAARLDLEVSQVEQALFAARNRLAEALVFGGRLTCDQVQSLDRAKLTRTEQRALKSHVRWCGECRGRGPLRGVGLVATIESLVRQLLQVVAGGVSAPAAATVAKVGAVAAAAALVTGAPVVGGALERHHARAAAGPAQALADLRVPDREEVVAAAPVFPLWTPEAAASTTPPTLIPAVARRAAPATPTFGLPSPASPAEHALPTADAQGLPQSRDGDGGAGEETGGDEAAPADEEQAAAEDPQPVGDPPPAEKPSADAGEPSAEAPPADPDTAPEPDAAPEAAPLEPVAEPAPAALEPGAEPEASEPAPAP